MRIRQSVKKSAWRWLWTLCLGGRLRLLTTVCMLYVSVNFLVQVYRKPAELLGFVSFIHNKTPTQTWSAYASFFERYQTERIPASFLAAMAQVESMGSAWATPSWHWTWAPVRVAWKQGLAHFDVFAFYKPMSSAVGLYQFIDGTFDQVSREHRPQGAWRVLPSHSIQLTAQYLDHSLRQLRPHSIMPKTSVNQTDLQIASVVHLCGLGRARSFVRRKESLVLAGRCGSHSIEHYVTKVLSLNQTFKKLQIESTPRFEVPGLRAPAR